MRRGASVGVVGLVGLVAVLAGAAACGGGSEGEAQPPDAAGDDADGEAAPGDDAGANADAGDAGRDAGRDAAVDAGPSFCAKLSPAPRFCEDFDDLDPSSRWDQATFLAGISSLDVDTTQYASPPASLLASTDARPAGESAVAHLRKTVTGSPTRAKLVFSVRPSATSFTQGAYSIADLDVTLSHIFTLYLRDDDDTGHKPSVKEIVGSTITYHPLPKVPPPNVWTRITLDVDAAAGKVTLLYDAETILDAIDVTPGTISDATFRIGAPYVFGPSDAFSVNVDDVVFDF